SKLDLEKIVGLGPDLLLLTARQKTYLPEVDRLGLSYLYLVEPDTVGGVLENIRLLGRVTGRTAQAADVVRGLQARLEQVDNRLTAVQKGPRVFHEITPDLFTAGPKSFLGDMYLILKAENIVRDDRQPFPKLSLEALVAEDPEVIILGDVGSAGGQSPATVKARPGWADISAVTNDR